MVDWCKVRFPELHRGVAGWNQHIAGGCPQGPPIEVHPTDFDTDSTSTSRSRRHSIRPHYTQDETKKNRTHVIPDHGMLVFWIHTMSPTRNPCLYSGRSMVPTPGPPSSHGSAPTATSLQLYDDPPPPIYHSTSSEGRPNLARRI